MEFSFKNILKIPNNLDLSEFWTMINYKDIKRNMYMISSKGRVKNINTGSFISNCKSEKGYVMVSLMCESGKQKTYKLHRIVGTTFVPGFTREKCELDHKDCDKENNDASNLEWVTHDENIHRAYKNNLIPKICGERHGNHSLKDAEIDMICELLCKKNGNCKSVRNELLKNGYEYDLHVIQRIKYKQTGMHISDKYFNKDDFKMPNDYRN